ncbi:MarR family winged helix-turn-helix transcriptional regulator [soil metagenome]
MTELGDTPCNCLALRKAARQVTQIYDAELTRVGLRATQFSILSVLGRAKQTTIGDLAQALAMDRSTVGHNLRPLERDELIAIAPAAHDRRARALELTAKGRAALKRARPLWARAQSHFEASYGEADAVTLRADLVRVVAAVTQSETRGERTHGEPASAD